MYVPDEKKEKLVDIIAAGIKEARVLKCINPERDDILAAFLAGWLNSARKSNGIIWPSPSYR